jgi:acetate kinase
LHGLQVVNAGSSWLKFDWGAVPGWSRTTSCLTVLRASTRSGRRIMHGGDVFVSRLVVDAEVGQLQDPVDLAPLHQPKSLAGLDEAGDLLQDVPDVACFDTALHATIPAAASTYALPRAWREQWPIVVAAREHLQVFRLIEEVVQTGDRP